MSILCDGKESFIKDVYWLFRCIINRDKTTCPRCGNKPFNHGYNSDYYCTECHLWEPDWEAINKDFKKIKEEEKI